jgi:hypothetical protein
MTRKTTAQTTPTRIIFFSIGIPPGMLQTGNITAMAHEPKTANFTLSLLLLVFFFAWCTTELRATEAQARFPLVNRSSRSSRAAGWTF